MASLLFPIEEQKSAYDIDYEKLMKKGFSGIIFDIDNTLVEHGAPANEKSLLLIRRIKELGFSVCVLSNNKEPRVKSFCEAHKLPYIFKAGKPKKISYEKAAQLLQLKRNQIISIGDQIFTDTLGANRAGIYSILVCPIGKKEEIQIVLKRFLEKIVLFFYHRKNRRQR